MMRYTLQQLRYFVAVAKYQNVTVASQKLFVSQPAISNAINKLEQTFGTQLMIRHHARGISLTSAGKKLVVEANNLRAHAEELQGNAKAMGNQLAGSLNIGCFVSMAPIVIPSLIKQFNKHYPHVEFRICCNDVRSIQSKLIAGDIEMAISYDLNLSDQLERLEIWRSKPYVLVSAKHPLANQKNISISQLKDKPMILFERPYSRDYFQTLHTSFGFMPNIRYRVDSFELVRSLVGSNLGYSILNQRPKTQECYNGSRLAYLPIKDTAHYLSIALIKIKGIQLTNKACAFWRFCQFELPSILEG